MALGNEPGSPAAENNNIIRFERDTKPTKKKKKKAEKNYFPFFAASNPRRERG